MTFARANWKFHLAEEDLKGEGAMICFSGCDDEGWYFVNGQYVGESHDWQAQPIFDAKNFSTLATMSLPWARSLFNGVAQVIVQSTKDAGEIKLTATGDGLEPATASVQTKARTPHPALP